MTDKNENSFDNLDAASLKYLAGVRKTIEECGMMSAATSKPHSPATINVTADSGPELTGMLRDIMGLAGVHKVEPHHMPIISTSPSPAVSATTNAGPSMKDLVGMFREEPEVMQDSMNDENRPYDSSPHEQEHEGNWPIDGDQDNNLVANKDAVVDRNKMIDAQSPTAESLYNEYKTFVAESKKCNCTPKGKKCPVHGMKECSGYMKEESEKTCCCKEEGKKNCPVHNDKKLKEEQIDEKAVSKQQQKFMGMVYAAKKGKKPASKEVAKAATGMSKKAAKDFASTKHKGLPKKKK